jgi:hypothetical protein
MLVIRVHGIKYISGTGFNTAKFILTFNFWDSSVLIIGDNHDNSFCVTLFTDFICHSFKSFPKHT